ncbi:3-deoxy-manno-octulosonate cytidylyltransferase [Devosia sp. ZB163]|uniref:3-deoxy-manno-octulosonate cytidylyltransferase n=1 Tax=Devosia sp. ZB163 TaxID=3025938 RepID=UPI0023613141|nr:3-deoxy-manno-octulosonate cytidylyltransferase [Devosia sp. ZB163]MDC9823611.1 3-deoxy-manno-octulosonate cytidylyltransferase [Devosia sp. ZB163]
MRDLIVIPARYGSTRLPGKPLHPIAGRALLERVASVAMAAARAVDDTDVVVATDDERILAKARELGLETVMTSPDISSGSGRALAALKATGRSAGLVVNLQGDAPFTSPAHLVEIMRAARNSSADVTTPVVQLDWTRLDALVAHKRTTPASGTTCIRAADGRAVWFSKSVLPYMRKESDLRQQSELSPVLQHIGLYCYRVPALEAFEAAPQSHYEQLEGLEQLRLIELGLDIRAIVVAPARITMSGVDSPSDVERAVRLIAEHGDPFVDWRS